jgi:hypothetical protein
MSRFAFVGAVVLVAMIDSNGEISRKHGTLILGNNGLTRVA